MPRQKKDYTPFNIKMESGLSERLDNYCEETGVSKTAATEKALLKYLNEYESDKKALEHIKNS